MFKGELFGLGLLLILLVALAILFLYCLYFKKRVRTHSDRGISTPVESKTPPSLPLHFYPLSFVSYCRYFFDGTLTLFIYLNENHNYVNYVELANGGECIGQQLLDAIYKKVPNPYKPNAFVAKANAVLSVWASGDPVIYLSQKLRDVPVPCNSSIMVADVHGPKRKLKSMV
jgi:hypothetical protein